MRIIFWTAWLTIPPALRISRMLGGSRSVHINWPRGAEKVGAGFCPKKAFGSRSRQAKRSACPTRGWVKSAPRPCKYWRHKRSPHCEEMWYGFSRTFFDRPFLPHRRGKSLRAWGTNRSRMETRATGQRRAHGPHTPLFRSAGVTDAILSPGRHTGAHRGK